MPEICIYYIAYDGINYITILLWNRTERWLYISATVLGNESFIVFEANVIKEKSVDVPLHYTVAQQRGLAFRLGGVNQMTLITTEMVDLPCFSET